MAKEMLTLRVSPEQKSKLETLSQQRGCSVSDILRSFIDNIDKQISVEIPEDCAEDVAFCAELKEQSIPEFVRGYVTGHIQRDINEECYDLILWKIRELLSKKPLTKDEIAALLPGVIREYVDNYLGDLLYYERVEETSDGKYQLKQKQ